MTSISSALALDGATSLSLVGGNIYAVAEEDDKLADILLWSTAIDRVEAGGSACVVSAAASTSLAQSGYGARVRAIHAGKQLSILEFTAASDAAQGVQWVRQLVEDLQHLHAGRADLLVLDSAEQWMPEADAEALQVLRDWAAAHHAAVLLLFRLTGAGAKDGVAAMLPLAHHFGGMARLKHRYGAASVEIYHWFATDGLVAKTSWPLQVGAQERLEVPADLTEHPAPAEPAADELLTFAQRSAFLAKESPLGSWHLVDGQDDIAAAVGSAVASTVILSFTPGADYFKLARCVFALRKQCGPRLKIVVREVNSRLRYSQETLLMRLGANLIVPAEISYARFLSMTSMVQGQIFPHRLPPSFEQALRQAMPDEDQGYLAPFEFVRAVATALERSRILHVQNVLLRMPLAYGLLPLDALRYCSIKRAGDLVSADGNSVYLFLYACRETDIDKTLERLFGLPVGELFSTEDRFLSPHTIRQAMADFDARNLQHPFPDLTAEMAGLAETKSAAPVEAAAPTDKKGPAVQRFQAPPPAVRRPLLVKGTPTLTDVSIPSS